MGSEGPPREGNLSRALAPRKNSSQKWFHVHFRVTCDKTSWGENLVLIGAGDVLGNYQVQSGLWMGCKEEPSSFEADEADDAEEKTLVWKARISIPAESCSSSHLRVGPYRYLIVDEKVEPLRGEPSWVARTFDIPLSLRDGSIVCVRDTWQDPSAPPCILRTAMFTKVVFKQALQGQRQKWAEEKQEAKASKNLRIKTSAGAETTNCVSFRVRNWQIDKGGRLFLLGSTEDLGEWDSTRALEMRLDLESSEDGGEGKDPYGIWRIDVRLPTAATSVSYKYCIEDGQGKRVLESGRNRLVVGREANQVDVGKVHIVQEDGHFRHCGDWKGAGIAAPVFALRSRNSLGCGDFCDLRQLIEFCASAGMTIIQLLPVNDTSVHDNWMDSYPYSSLSVFALHPMYLSVREVLSRCREGALARGEERAKALGNISEEVEALASALDTPEVDYEGTLEAKHSLCERLFCLLRAECYADSDFRNFLESSAFWLAPYATFCAIKKIFGHSDHTNWGSIKNASLGLVRRLITGVQEGSGSGCKGEGEGEPSCALEDFGCLHKDLLELFNPKTASKPSIDFLVPFRDLIAYHCFVQYHLHVQFSEVAQFAEDRGVALKGDLPIGVDKNSVECWVKRECFRMNKCAGAPPDYYAVEGQNWGFPTYNWEEMRRDGYSWWKRRLSHMSLYFHSYRIDHILGFFRIWEVPSSNNKEAVNGQSLLPGLLGRFEPAVAIEKAELDSKGIWDIDRLCKPYITEELLSDLFGDLAEVVADFFLFKRHSYYELKDTFSTTNDIFWREGEGEGKWAENFLTYLKISRQGEPADQAQSSEAILTRVRTGLRKAIQNVVLLRDESCAQKFHPRFACLDTHSFKALEPWEQKVIAHFHDEYYFRRQDDLWRKNAVETLPKLVQVSPFSFSSRQVTRRTL